MLYEFNVYQAKIDDHIFWVAESKALKGCIGQGESADNAIKELEENEKEWLKTAKEYDIPVPQPSYRIEKKYTGKYALRMSPYVHEQAATEAQALGVSLNQYINDAVVEYTVKTKLSSRAYDDNSNTKIVIFANQLIKQEVL